MDESKQCCIRDPQQALIDSPNQRAQRHTDSRSRHEILASTGYAADSAPESGVPRQQPSVGERSASAQVAPISPSLRRNDDPEHPILRDEGIRHESSVATGDEARRPGTHLTAHETVDDELSVLAKQENVPVAESVRFEVPEYVVAITECRTHAQAGHGHHTRKTRSAQNLDRRVENAGTRFRWLAHRSNRPARKS